MQDPAPASVHQANSAAATPAASKERSNPATLDNPYAVPTVDAHSSSLVWPDFLPVKPASALFFLISCIPFLAGTLLLCVTAFLTLAGWNSPHAPGVLFPLGILLSLYSELVQNPANLFWLVPSLILASGLSIANLVTAITLIYRCWNSVSKINPISRFCPPVVMTLLVLFPVINVAGVFPAVLGFAIYWRRLRKQFPGAPLARVSPALALGFCLCHAGMFVFPPFALIAMALYPIIGVQLCRAINSTQNLAAGQLP